MSLYVYDRLWSSTLWDCICLCTVHIPSRGGNVQFTLGWHRSLGHHDMALPALVPFPAWAGDELTLQPVSWAGSWNLTWSCMSSNPRQCSQPLDQKHFSLFSLASSQRNNSSRLSLNIAQSNVRPPGVRRHGRDWVPWREVWLAFAREQPPGRAQPACELTGARLLSIIWHPHSGSPKKVKSKGCQSVFQQTQGTWVDLVFRTMPAKRPIAGVRSGS